MKRFIKTLISTALFVTILISAFSVLKSVYSEREFPAGTYTDYYYQSLGEKEKQAYTQIKESIFSFPEKIETPVLTQPQLETVLNALIYDNPMLFMLDKCSLEIKGERAFFVPVYSVTQDKYKTDAQNISEIINQLLRNIPADRYEAELYCHDYIINTCTYSDTGFHEEDTVAGVFLGGKAKCSGYAKAFKLLLNAAGIESVLVTGDATDYNGKTQSHMWNAVKIDDSWCYTDITWNDPVGENGENYIQHIYFNMTEEMLSRTHTDFEFRYKCNSPSLFYYIINKAYFEKADSEMISALSHLISKACLTNYSSVEIMLSDSEALRSAENYLFEKEKVYRALETAALETGLSLNTNSVKYTVDTNTNLITIYYEIKD